MVLLLPAPPAVAIGETTVRNPLLANGADPWMQYYNGNYYLATTTWTQQLVMRKAPTVNGLKTAAPVYVWAETASDRCCNFWAFEFHRLNGPNGIRWYMMYTAGVSANLDGQKLRVLESAGDDPMGPYRYMGTPMPNTWNIDGSYLTLNGQLYLLWSEFQGADQSIWIARMTNPWTITGSRVLISRPTLSWETQGGRVNEGPEVLQRNGRTFIAYSASSCNTQFYKLGMLTLTGSDPMQPASWSKAPNPVFQASNGVYGPGHNGFFTSPDGSESWIVYHGNASATQGCGSTRSTRIQRFTWNSNGTPNFGSPVSTSTDIAVPAGERGPITAAARDTFYTIANRNSGLCAGVTGSSGSDGANVVQAGCGVTSSQWVLDPTADGYYRLINRSSSKALDVVNCGTGDGVDVGQWAWLDNACQQWQVIPTGDGWFRLQNRNSGRVLNATGCGTTEGSNVDQSSWTGSNCQQFRLQPAGQVAITSKQSGKVLDVANCSTANGADVRQWAWGNVACQRWIFNHIDNGWYRISPASAPSSCLIVAGGSTADGANVEQGACTGSNSQWRVEPLADGSARLVPRHSGKALDLANCGLADGTNIVQWSWLNNLCQRFHLRPV
ncbi:MAG TPA: RICIN domain-containing protein [Candidatus Limnocylindrales bacterium]